MPQVPGKWLYRQRHSIGVKETTFGEIPTSQSKGSEPSQKNTVTTVEFLDGWRNKPYSQMTSKEKYKYTDELNGTDKFGKLTIDTKGGTLDDSWLRG